MQVFSEPLRAGACLLSPSMFQTPEVEALPEDVFCGVAIFGDDLVQADALAATCVGLNLVPLMAGFGRSPFGLCDRQAPLLALVQGCVADEAEVSIAHSCRELGICRVVLVGPDFGSAQAQAALLRGFDEVWPSHLPHGLGVVFLQKAWQTAKRLGALDGASVLRVGPLAIGRGVDSLIYRSRVLSLSGESVALLRVLAKNFPNPVSRGALVQALGKAEQELAANTRIVDVSVMRLRQRLQAAGVRGVNIATYRGVGYGLELDGFPA